MLAIDAQAIVIPLTIQGTHDILPAKTWHFASGKTVTVTIGQPIDTKGMTADNRDQLMADVHWGDLDYLIVDMPPGTGDVQITFSQQLKVSGALLVATPQVVALADVVRAKFGGQTAGRAAETE